MPFPTKVLMQPMPHLMPTPQCANQMQGHPWSTELPQILNPDSPSVNFNPSRLRCRLIIEFKLQLMIKRLLAVVVRMMLRSRLFRLFGSAKYSEPPGFIKLAEPGDDSLPRPVCCSIRFDERPVRRALTIFLLEVLAKKHGRACYRPICQPPDYFFSLHHVSTRRQTTYENATAKTRQKIFAANDFLPSWGAWANPPFMNSVESRSRVGGLA